MVAAVAIFLLGAVVALPQAVATNDGVCTTGEGWVKYEYEGGAFVQETGDEELLVEVTETKDGDEPMAVSVTAPDGYLVSEVCVKAGTDKVSEQLSPAVPTVTIDAPEKAAISHFAVKLVVDTWDWNWEYPAPTCEGTLTVTYPDDIPEGQANDVNVKVKNLDTDEVVTINIHNDEGTWTGEQVFDPTSEPEWPGWESWAFVWTQVAGTNYHWKGHVEVGCDEPVEPSFEAEATPAVCVDGETEGGSFTYTVTVGSEHGTRNFQVKDLGDGTGGTAETYYRADGTIGAPGEIVTFATIEAGATATLSLDDLPPGDYRVVSDGSRKVKKQYKWDFTIEAPEDCGPTEEISPTVQVTQAQCLPQPQVVKGQTLAPASIAVTGVSSASVTVTGPTGTVEDLDDLVPGSYTITVTPAEGQVFGSLGDGWIVEDGVASLEVEIVEVADCWEHVVVTPPAPEYVDQCGTESDDVLLPEDSLEGSWKLGSKVDMGDGTTRWRVVFTPAEGYVLADEGTWDKVVDGKAVWLFFTDNRDCVTAEPPAVQLVCGIGAEQAVTFPEIDGVTYSMWQAPSGLYTIKAEVDPSTHILLNGSAQNPHVKWFKLDLGAAEEECPPEPKEITPPAPTPADQCGTEVNLTVDLPESDKVTFTTESTETGVVVAATPNPGYVFAEPEGQSAEEWSWTFTDSLEACAEPTLAGSLAAGECVADAPWINYDVRLTDPDGQSAATSAFLVLSDGTHEETLPLGELDADGMLSGRTLWPGASVADDGVTPTGWPGWAQRADGTWVETDGNYAWTRGDITATLVVNPEVAVDLAYPPATPNCAAEPPQTDPTPAPSDPVDASDEPTPDAEIASDGDPLPQTGSDIALVAIGALVLIATGGAFLWLRRRA
ncbi:LPXTG cell wall anchor domain-containing protein [Isoptericola sp. AK164]|uniref:LPXTG cell wall anchor domain-containing protein n=1 Tax=Isoptericola sp. AK164 TaxID=3024246 RepID=UPI0024184922|nr:LPXTG cell wall anchor domain-containing protein [Isoptericola sp. AK164]